MAGDYRVFSNASLDRLGLDVDLHRLAKVNDTGLYRRL
jgi:hypothetical protein